MLFVILMNFSVGGKKKRKDPREHFSRCQGAENVKCATRLIQAGLEAPPVYQLLTGTVQARAEQGDLGPSPERRVGELLLIIWEVKPDRQHRQRRPLPHLGGVGETWLPGIQGTALYIM